MTYKTLQLESVGDTATITLSRADKRNAISYDLISDLIRALQEVATNSAALAGAKYRGLANHGESVSIAL